ncbi:Cyclic nucleotide-binding domain [Popillia japonica]|uniref:Cyclic nucleotide-binding domain n=1 Tax=Popillia japonica TaxID=7064 RepID=A0AAW1NAM2_POPJA
MLTAVPKFEREGHFCQIPFVPPELFMFEEEESRFRRFRNYVIRLRMATADHAGGWNYLPSHASIMAEHRKHLKHLYIIHPFSTFRIYWDMFMIIIFGLQFIAIPLEVAIYSTEIRKQFRIVWYPVRLSLDALCLVDICLRFMSGYVQETTKEIILDPEMIMIHYCKTLFVPDILSSVLNYSEILPIGKLIVHILKSGSLLKLVRLVTFLRYCQHFADQAQISYTVYNITMVIICYVLFVHIVTCTTIFLETIAPKLTLIKKYYWRFQPVMKDFYQAYVVNCLRALIMINNIDFGSQPVSVLVSMYILLIWIISKVINIVIITYIMKIVVTRRSANIKYTENIRQLLEFMRHKKLPEQLQKRILCYYEFRYEKNFFREADILESLTGSLKTELILRSCKKLVQNVDFLNELPPFLLVKIVSYLKYEVFMINDVIFRHDTPGYCMYFILTGSVAVYTSKGAEVVHLKDGAYFGEIALLTNVNRVGSVVSVEVSELYRLDRKDFVKVIAPHKYLVRKIKNRAERRLEDTIMMMKKSHSRCRR